MPPKSAPKGKGAGSCEEEKPETSQNVPMGTIDLGSFEEQSDHGDAAEDDVDVNELSEEACQLPLGLRRQRLQSTQRCIAGSFQNLAMEIAETKSLHSSIVGIGNKSSRMFCSKWILGHEVHRSQCPV